MKWVTHLLNEGAADALLPVQDGAVRRDTLRVPRAWPGPDGVSGPPPRLPGRQALLVAPVHQWHQGYNTMMMKAMRRKQLAASGIRVGMLLPARIFLLQLLAGGVLLMGPW